MMFSFGEYILAWSSSLSDCLKTLDTKVLCRNWRCINQGKAAHYNQAFRRIMVPRGTSFAAETVREAFTASEIPHKRTVENWRIVTLHPPSVAGSG